MSAPFSTSPLRSFLWGALILAALELASRLLGAHAISRPDEELQFRRKQHWLARHGPVPVLLTGDSSVELDLNPRQMEVAGTPEVLNAALAGGSAIVSEALAHAPAWRPQEVIYGGTPLALIDSAMQLQRHERRLISVWDPDVWTLLSADVVLGKISSIYEHRIRYRGWLLNLASGRAIPKALSDDGLDPKLNDATGFYAEPDSVFSPAERRGEVEVFFASILPHPPGDLGVRARRLKLALAAWGAPEGKRTMIVMPVSSELREAIRERIGDEALLRPWRTVAADTGSALLDCRAAMPDDQFRDIDHLIHAGADTFSTAIAQWLLHHSPPPGCAQLR